jgi:FMN-binding domain
VQRFRRTLLLAPLAFYASSSYATTYFTLAQVQAAMLPNASWTAAQWQLSEAELKAIKAASKVNVRDATVKTWLANTGERLIVDQVLGKHEFITYALLLDKTGAVAHIEVMDYKETYGDQIRQPKWRAQFYGKQNGAPLTLDQDIKNISGATLSCKHISDGVKRLLATHALVSARAS